MPLVRLGEESLLTVANCYVQLLLSAVSAPETGKTQAADWRRAPIRWMHRMQEYAMHPVVGQCPSGGCMLE